MGWLGTQIRQHEMRKFRTLEVNIINRIRPNKKNKFVFFKSTDFQLHTSKGGSRNPLLAGPTAPSPRHGSGRDPRAQELPTRKSVRRLCCGG